MMKKRRIFLGCSLLVTIAAIVTASLLILSNSAPEIVVEPIRQKKFILRPLFGPPSVNQTGLEYVYIVPHQADPGAAFASNWSGTIYEESTEFNEEMANNTPYGTTFNILYLVQVNWSDGYNTSSSAWDLNYSYFLLTCADLGIGAGTNLTEILVGNNAHEMWVHYYHNNGGAGFTIGADERVNLTSERLFVLD